MNNEQLYPAAATSSLVYCNDGSFTYDGLNSKNIFTASSETEHAFGDFTDEELILKINVVSLPSSGARYEVTEGSSPDGSSEDTSNPAALVLGLNTITVPAASFNRYVKFLFDDNNFEFSSMTLNNVDTKCTYT